MGTFCNIKVRHEAQWQWARYLGELDNDRCYVEMDVGNGGRIKRRFAVKAEKVQWVHVERWDHPGILPTNGEGPRPPEEIEQVTQWRADGKTWDFIAGKLEVSTFTARRRHGYAK